jgi:hypothetical protein
VAWEKRRGCKGRYYYRSTRVDGQVKKLYFGTGMAGLLAAAVEDRRRADAAAVRAAHARERERVAAVTKLTARFGEQVALLRDAALLVAGYHRPRRVPWRKWHAARKACGLPC